MKMAIAGTACLFHVVITSALMQADFRVYDEHLAPDAAQLRKRSRRFALHEHVPVFSTDSACEYLSLWAPDCRCDHVIMKMEEFECSSTRSRKCWHSRKWLTPLWCDLYTARAWSGCLNWDWGFSACETNEFLHAHRHAPNDGVCVTQSFWNLETFCSTYDHPDITVLVDWA